LVPREGLDDAGARAVAGDLDKLACAPPIGEIAGTSVGTNPRRTELFGHSVRLVLSIPRRIPLQARTFEGQARRADGLVLFPSVRRYAWQQL